MKLTRYTSIIALGAFVVSCSTVKNITAPSGTNAAISIPAKKVFSETEINTWSHADLMKDSIPGISLAKAYEFLKGKTSQTVIVAVADSGSDIQHEDLKGVLWTNKGEIAGNGIDDDKNGFIDDIHGWNFLGDTYDETLEVTRMYRQQKPLYEGKTKADFKGKALEDFNAFKLLEADFSEELAKSKKSQKEYSDYLNMMDTAHKAMQTLTGKADYTLEDVKGAGSAFDFADKQKQLAIRVLSSGTTFPEQIAQIEPAVDHYTSKVNHYYNVNFDGRAPLGDNAYDMSVKVYGNNNVDDQGADEIHGTHVSGIILADRNNDKGAKGIANNALLMPVRVVPNGDEYDKDVALGIKYAVDNGAKVINTSFGKGYSPKANWVYDAIKYAAKKDVLIVNAAGNDAQNIDEKATFPTDAPDFKNEVADNVLTIGATTRFYNEKLLAEFSNYGKENVDIFSPGHDIYNSIINNEYKKLSGTSMASPTTAGVAALIRSYYPQLSASQVKHIIMNSGALIEFEVLIPETDQKVKLSELCKSGRILNAYNALKMADAMVNFTK